MTYEMMAIMAGIVVTFVALWKSFGPGANAGEHTVRPVRACRNCMHWGQHSLGAPYGTCCNNRRDGNPPPTFNKKLWPQTYESDSCDLFNLQTPS